MTTSSSSAVNEVAVTPARGFYAGLILLSLGLAVLWWFPVFWYTNTEDESRYHWFSEQTRIEGWTYREAPVSKAAEAILVADRMVNGEFESTNGAKVLVYSAKRFLKKENEIGLFSHTPDRCWTAAGWKLEPGKPDYVEQEVHGVKMLLERRIFALGKTRELVYFGALVGGKALPYRIDQYQSAASQSREGGTADAGGMWVRLAQMRLWSWAWDCFLNRSPFGGPQQFVRLSTQIRGDPAAADRLLHQFVETWLIPIKYADDLAAWKQARK